MQNSELDACVDMLDEQANQGKKPQTDAKVLYDVKAQAALGSTAEASPSGASAHQATASIPEQAQDPHQRFSLKLVGAGDVARQLDFQWEVMWSTLLSDIRGDMHALSDGDS